MEKTLKVITKLKDDMKNKDVEMIEYLFKQKECLHKELAKLPVEKKIDILIQMQKLADSVKKSSRKGNVVWNIS